MDAIVRTPRPGLIAHSAQLAALRSLQFPYRLGNERGQDVDPQASPEQIEQQVDIAIELNHELFWEWHARATDRTERRTTTAWDFTGPVSDLELVQMQFNPTSPPEQHKGASMELRERFKNDNLVELQRRAIAAWGEE